ncbi:NAD-dependent epimerase/dehydratase family protein [Microlunatus panaciterrae]|uniref:UDP-2-acetamido-2,6-beta-L-arabino-hexul-4-ose reductase n=1 Tax=Microlunatus panaciterrae TaxID=400768 RepID=A0ABS2RHR9_9ACTN|nr:NAD-dependent epimerase/dehydratase family protein [Microlunatus panaciterrae]MBM7798540.1 UDP-2-acetamido-2,6-beta-L-arabino-hexul-4-ose reductase [Microlunatus panaciterrae]
MKVLLTGAGGFLGWHTRVRLRALTEHEVVAVDRDSWSQLPELVKDVDAVIHIAGVNRATPEEVEQGNVQLARDVAAAVLAAGGSPTVVFANSIQSGNDTPYGAGKSAASDLLAATARQTGSIYVDVRLPNLFGEHGRPQYNSFVATFVTAVVNGETPQISDRPVDLLHVQGAADALIGALSETASTSLSPAGTATTVQGVFDTLRTFNQLYDTGDIPPLLTDLDIDLFNTLRAARFPAHYPIGLTPRSDNRGSLVEVVRAHGGQGQTFVSTTKPAITRGEHFHLRKVERFVVLSGQARISLRKMFSDEVVSFDVTGDQPSIVDMPTMWVHNITNTGSTELTTLFWTHELFNPASPDTFAEPVLAPAAGVRS